MKAYEFSVGFPFSPKIFTLFRHRETEFTLRLLPLGGFVRFSGDGDEEARGLFGAAPFSRALILATGPLFNIAFAYLLVVALFAAQNNFSFPEALALGAKTVWSVLSGTFGLLVRACSGQVTWDVLVGPVGIAASAGTAAAGGLADLLHFTAMLSLSLGFMNLVPFPALDGGQLLMLLIEALRRRPLGFRAYQAVNATGMALFLALTLLVTYKDIARITA